MHTCKQICYIFQCSVFIILASSFCTFKPIGSCSWPGNWSDLLTLSWYILVQNCILLTIFLCRLDDVPYRVDDKLTTCKLHDYTIQYSSDLLEMDEDTWINLMATVGSFQFTWYGSGSLNKCKLMKFPYVICTIFYVVDVFHLYNA